MSRSLIIFVLAVSIFSCNRNQRRNETAGEKGNMVQGVGKVGSEISFPMPELPLMVNSEEDAKAFMVAHFWDDFRFADTILLGSRNVISNGLSDFISMSADMKYMYGGEVTDGFRALCKGITENPGKTDSLKYYVEEFLYNPNSPYYNEELYGIYLKEMIAALPDDNPMVSVYNFKLKLISRNCVGSKAENFYYFLPDGTKRSLYATKINGGYTILVFYDPECHSCHDVMMEMFADREMYDAVNRGIVTVMAIYVNGDTEVWKKYLNGMPDNWIIGDDRRTIIESSLYDLKAMPTLYLLDNNKRVVLKDAPYDMIRKRIIMSKG